MFPAGDHLCPSLTIPVSARWSRWARKRPQGSSLHPHGTPEGLQSHTLASSTALSHLYAKDLPCPTVWLCGDDRAGQLQVVAGAGSHQQPSSSWERCWHRVWSELWRSLLLLPSDLCPPRMWWVGQSSALLPSLGIAPLNQHLEPVQNDTGFFLPSFFFFLFLSFSISHKAERQKKSL